MPFQERTAAKVHVREAPEDSEAVGEEVRHEGQAQEAAIGARMQQSGWSVAIAYVLGMLTALIVLCTRNPHDR